MGDSAILEPSVEEASDTGAEEQEVPEEVPSVFSVINHHLIGRADVSPATEDGSRILRLSSVGGTVIIEANLAPQLCEFISTKLVEVEVIEEVDAEVVEDAGPSQ